MSDHEMNFASDSENAQDGAHPIANSTTRANLPSATHTSTEASDLLQSATPIGMVPLSSYSWPQPRGDTSSARERGSTAHRRLPAAIRAVFTGEPEGMCIFSMAHQYEIELTHIKTRSQSPRKCLRKRLR